MKFSLCFDNNKRIRVLNMLSWRQRSVISWNVAPNNPHDFLWWWLRLGYKACNEWWMLCSGKFQVTSSDVQTNKHAFCRIWNMAISSGSSRDNYYTGKLLYGIKYCKNSISSECTCSQLRSTLSLSTPISSRNYQHVTTGNRWACSLSDLNSRYSEDCRKFKRGELRTSWPLMTKSTNYCNVRQVPKGTPLGNYLVVWHSDGAIPCAQL